MAHMWGVKRGGGTMGGSPDHTLETARDDQSDRLVAGVDMCRSWKIIERRCRKLSVSR